MLVQKMELRARILGQHEMSEAIRFPSMWGLSDRPVNKVLEGVYLLQQKIDIA